MRGRWIALPVVALGVAIATAAFGLSKSVDPVAAAATRSEDAGGAKMTMTMSVNAGTGKTFTVTANGVFEQGEADMTMDLSSILGAAGVPSGVTGGGGQIEIRYLQENGDPVMYLNFPALSGQMPGGKSWIRLDLETAAKGLGVDLNQLLGQANQNPADTLDMLRASGPVTTVGTETVDGVETTHYQASIDLATAAAKLGGTAGTAIQHMIDQGGPSSIPVDVWIGNDDGLVHKMTMDEQLAMSGQSADMTLTMDISDYGTPVDVVAPPSDDTFDASGLVSQLAQGAVASSASSSSSTSVAPQTGALPATTG